MRSIGRASINCGLPVTVGCQKACVEPKTIILCSRNWGTEWMILDDTPIDHVETKHQLSIPYSEWQGVIIVFFAKLSNHSWTLLESFLPPSGSYTEPCAMKAFVSEIIVHCKDILETSETIPLLI